MREATLSDSVQGNSSRKIDDLVQVIVAVLVVLPIHNRHVSDIERVSFSQNALLVLLGGDPGRANPAGQHRPGEPLDSSFHFPAGYVFRSMDGSTHVSAGAVTVAAVEPAGVADVFGGIVNETGRYFVTAGVLCKA